MRLGLPFAAYVLLLQPVVMYALERPLGAATGSYWYEFLGKERQIDTGPLWFVGVLLVFSLTYASWVAVRRRPTRCGAGQLTARQLVVVAGVVAPLSFLVRLVYPYGSESGVTDLNFWEWPACIALFAVGIGASGQGWLAAVPQRLSRLCRTTTRWAGPPVIRSAYGAFMLQTPVLIGLAVALRPVPLLAEVKAVVVAAGGIAVTFALSWLLVSRIPAVARVL